MMLVCVCVCVCVCVFVSMYFQLATVRHVTHNACTSAIHAYSQYVNQRCIAALSAGRTPDLDACMCVCVV